MVAEFVKREASPDAFLLGTDADDAGNADAMMALYGQDFLHSRALGWLHWTGTHWQRVSDDVVSAAAVESLRRRRLAAVDARAHGNTGAEAIVKATAPDKRRIDGCVYVFKAHVAVQDVRDFDVDPDLLNCANGVLNMRTGTLAQHCPKQRFTYCLAVEYDPEADTAPVHNFIHQVVDGDEDTCHYLQECIGYSLTGHTREEKLFYVYGPPRSGKGTFSEMLLALLPRPLGNEVDFNSFTAKRDTDAQNFDLADLKASRLVFASESNRFQSLNPAKIKQVTGGNLIRCAHKHKDLFEYRPQFKVWLISNHEVNGDPDDDALWSRIQVFVFPRSHVGEEDMEYKASMQRPEVLQGLLRWALEGAKRWYEAKRLTAPESVLSVTQSQRDAQDYHRQWAVECTVKDAEAWASSAELMKSYQDWCEQQNIKAGRPQEMASALRRFGCQEARSGHARTRGFSGIRVRELQEEAGLGWVRTEDSEDSKNGVGQYIRDSTSATPKEVSSTVLRPQERNPVGVSMFRVAPNVGKECGFCHGHVWKQTQHNGETLYYCGYCHPELDERKRK